MDGVRVRPDEMRALATKIDNILERYNTSINNIYRDVASLKEAWDAESYNSFKMTLDNKLKDINEMRETIASYGKLLNSAANMFETLDNTMSAMFKN